MGYIKEPPGVDFIINSGQLTKEQEAFISKYIRNYKIQQAATQKIRKPTVQLKSTKKKVVA